MIIIACALLVVLSVPLTGGHLGRLRGVRVLHPAVPVVAVGMQTVAVDGPLARLDVVPWVLHAVSYLLIMWVLWANRHVPFLWLVAVGGLMNLAAITANGGVMPATPAAMARAGLAPSGEFANSAVSTGSPLWFLGDVFAIPAGWPLANVFSAGDVVLVVGLAVLLHRLARVESPGAAVGAPEPAAA